LLKSNTTQQYKKLRNFSVIRKFHLLWNHFSWTSDRRQPEELQTSIIFSIQVMMRQFVFTIFNVWWNLAEENDLQQYERTEDVPSAEVKPVVKPTLRKEALRKMIEDLIYELDDVAYSKFSSRTDDIEKQIKKTKQEKREPCWGYQFYLSFYNFLNYFTDFLQSN
jgi:hypothetical protein